MVTEVTDDLVKEFKVNMNITHDDKKLKGILKRSIAYIKTRCGDVELNDDSDVEVLAKDLVLNRARYDYYESTDLFEDNYLSDLIHLAMLLAGGDDNDEE